MEETPTTDGIISSTMSGIGFASVREASSMRLGSASPLSSEDEDEAITTGDELNQIKNTYKAGDTIKLTVERHGEDIDIPVTLQENKEQAS